MRFWLLLVAALVVRGASADAGDIAIVDTTAFNASEPFIVFNAFLSHTDSHPWASADDEDWPRIPAMHFRDSYLSAELVYGSPKQKDTQLFLYDRNDVGRRVTTEEPIVLATPIQCGQQRSSNLTVTVAANRIGNIVVITLYTRQSKLRGVPGLDCHTLAALPVVYRPRSHVESGNLMLLPTGQLRFAPTRSVGKDAYRLPGMLSLMFVDLLE